MKKLKITLKFLLWYKYINDVKRNNQYSRHWGVKEVDNGKNGEFYFNVIFVPGFKPTVSQTRGQRQ